MTESSDQDDRHVHSEERDLYVLYCREFRSAARYAAERGWWLHCWQWRTDDQAPDEPVVIELRPPRSETP